MEILLLGGTVFLGRHIAQAAVAAGHHVTIFHRGQHPAPDDLAVAEILGDREVDLGRLAGRQWDVVIDTSGFVPHQVRTAVAALGEHTGRYLFISTISVYPETIAPGADEAAGVVELPEGASTEERSDATYGALKALCEAELLQSLLDRATIIRPGLIVGPDDPTDRFTYWPRRLAASGEVLVPGAPDRPIQFIDVRDLAEWTVRLAETGTLGTFNATGPAERLSMGAFLTAAQAAVGGTGALTWVADQLLLDQGVGPWMELPLWIPATEAGGFMQVAIHRALAAGLTFRPLAETVRATLAWDRRRPEGIVHRAGLAAEKERAVLAAWHAAMP